VSRGRPTTFTTPVRGRVRSFDFFTHDLGECVVTNPPFSELPRILARLRELGKPFVVIMPCSTLTTRSKTSRSSCLGGASSSGSRWTACRCQPGGAASTAFIFVGDLGCRGTSCSWGDGRFYPRPRINFGNFGTSVHVSFLTGGRKLFLPRHFGFIFDGRSPMERSMVTYCVKYVTSMQSCFAAHYNYTVMRRVQRHLYFV
jgi:hypothetical protein